MPPQDPKAPDPKDFLLPKKEGAPSADSAQRINAGALLAQEQDATLLNQGPKPAAEQKLAGSGEINTTPTPAPATSVAPSEEKSAVHSLQTYSSDIEKVVEDKNVSVVNIAAAEAKRREQQGGEAEPASEAATNWRTYAMYGGGALLVAAAVGLAAFVALRDTALPPAPELQAPFISVDSYQQIEVPESATRDSLSTSLMAARSNSALSLGLVDWLYLSRPAPEGGQPTPLSATDFLSTLTPNLPAALARTLVPTYLLGLHSFDENQPLLLLQADAYTTAYAGMLEWERTMRGDLGPLFVRTPSPRAPVQSVGSSTPAQQPVFIQSNFVDKIVENRDVRALLNEQGDILLLWTMLGRNIILITTNEYTLRETVSRMNVAPTIPQPGQ